MMIAICCDAFGLHYSPIDSHVAKFEQIKDGTWNIEGCCGGCYVVQNMRYCPYCGTQIKSQVIIDIEDEK